MKTKILIAVLILIIIVLGLLLIIPGLLASKNALPAPTAAPTSAPTSIPTALQTTAPTALPTAAPTQAPTKVAGVTISVPELKLVNKETASLTAIIDPSTAKNKKVTWKSADKSIASVDASGLVRAKAHGTTFITATTSDGAKTAKCKVSVSPQEITGTFDSVVWGDYLHLTLKDGGGKLRDFFVLKNVGVDPETLTKGQKIKVQWQNVDTYLDAPAAVTNIDEIVKIEKL